MTDYTQDPTLNNENQVIADILHQSIGLANMPDLSEELFSDPINKRIFQAASQAHSKGLPTDMLNVAQIDGDIPAQYMMWVVQFAYNTNPELILSHVKILKEQHRTNRIKTLSEMLNNTNDMEQVLSITDKIASIATEDTNTRPNNSTSLADSIKERVSYYNNGEEPKITRTWLKTLDNILGGGLFPQTLNILAARPAMGKTSLSMIIAEQVAYKGGSVLVFSMEMSKEQHTDDIIARQIYRTTKEKVCISGTDLRNKYHNAKDISLDAAIDSLDKWSDNLEINTRARTVESMRIECMRFKREHEGLDLVIIDHVQLMNSIKDRPNRIAEITDISRGLKEMAMDLDIPILCLSQLNRGTESRPDKRPILSDLRESGSIEQDADTVIGLYRDIYYNADEYNKDTTKDLASWQTISEIIPLKNRNGATTDKCYLEFNGKIKLFYEPSQNDIETYKNKIREISKTR